MNTNIIEKSVTKDNNYRNSQEYEALVDECRAIIVERGFIARSEIIVAYGEVGQRIYNDPLYQKFSKGNNQFIRQLCNDLRINIKTGYSCIHFYEKYIHGKFSDVSNVLETLPEGKNISWHKIVNLYLPQPKENKVTIPLPTGEFDVIYADVPWRYDFSETMVREVENQYPTMTVEEIEQIQVPSASNAVLFLWATAPKLREALRVMESWGFEYKTNIIWDKEIIGMGYWARGQHELLLIGVKGVYPAPSESMRESSVYREKRTIHSKKPEHYHSLIEKLCPNGKYLELFARTKNGREKWTFWGDEVDQKVSCSETIPASENSAKKNEIDNSLNIDTGHSV